MSKEDLALNNPQRLIGHKTVKNQNRNNNEKSARFFEFVEIKIK